MNKSRNEGSSESPKDVEQITVPSPDPMELAKLAAILLPGSAPKFGLQKAMEFYLEAVLTVSELPPDFDDLLTLYGSAERKKDRTLRELKEAFHQEREVDAFRLEPDRDCDDARRYLDEQARLAGVIVKRKHFLRSARSVIDNLREYYESIPVAVATAKIHRTFDQFLEDMKRKTDDGREYYAIPRSWLAGERREDDGRVFPIGLVQYKKEHTSEVRKKGRKTLAAARLAASQKPVKKNLQRKSESNLTR